MAGWMLAHIGNGKLAARVLRDAYDKQRIDQADLTIHADRATSATSKTVADLLDTLGVRRSFRRPRVRDDNPHIEAYSIVPVESTVVPASLDARVSPPATRTYAVYARPGTGGDAREQCDAAESGLLSLEAPSR